jgi:hypothetical protein
MIAVICLPPAIDRTLELALPLEVGGAACLEPFAGVVNPLNIESLLGVVHA